MVTKFGKLLRKIRIDHGEILKNMADRLGVSPSFLSAVEVGRKSAPTGWSDIITDSYHLSEEQRKELREAEQEAVVSVKIDFANSEQPQRTAAFVFARQFGSMSDETAKQVIQLLSRSGHKEG